MAATFIRATLAGLGDIIMAAGTTSRNGGTRLARPAQASYDVCAGVFGDGRHARLRLRELASGPIPKLVSARGTFRRELRVRGYYARGEDRMTDAASRPWPTELRLRKDRRALTVAFDSGESFELSAEYLRVKSPSAEVQGHSPDERKTVAGKKNVAILEVNPIGNYAVRLVFDDLHSTGIYSWDYLLALGRNRDAYWRDYLDDLAGKGLTR
jgi:DUF971 family protein